MQIHEITALNEGAWDATKQFTKSLGSAAADELENLAFGGPVTDYSKIEPVAKPKDQGPTPDQYSAAEKTRKEKQELAAKAAQDQMAPFSKFQPAATPAPGTQMATTTPDPEVLDPVARRAQKYTGIDNNNVIDVDAQEVPDPAKVAKLPQSAPAQLARPAAQLPRPVAAPNFAQTNRTKYQPATVNAPVATVPNMPATVPPKPAAPVVNPAAKPEVYVWDGQPLNPKNPVHARLIAQMQAAGVTKAKTRAPKR
jgi:hypothetical protein